MDVDLRSLAKDEEVAKRWQDVAWRGSATLEKSGYFDITKNSEQLRSCGTLALA